MLLIDDDDAMPESPTQEELAFFAGLSEEECRQIDARLLAACGPRFLELARAVSEAMNSGGYEVKRRFRVHPGRPGS